jgi:ABC-type multidrug transport system fused ATPase/permease subunit
MYCFIELLFESPDVVDLPGAVPIPLNVRHEGCGKSKALMKNEGEEIQVDKIVVVIDDDVKDAAVKDSDVKGAAVKDSDVKSAAVRDSDVKGAAVKDGDVKSVAVKDGDVKSAAVKDSDVKSAAVKDSDATSDVVKGVSVEFRDIYFHYPSQDSSKGIRGINILIKAGSTTAIVGHTGAGKTTISRLLFRFYDPQEGSVLLDGHDIRQYTQQSVRQAIGVVPQDTVLFNDTLLHNIRYGRMDASMAEIKAAAEAAQILSFIESLPEGWETSVGERGLKLSGGEKQRVAIGKRTLYSNICKKRYLTVVV